MSFQALEALCTLITTQTIPPEFLSAFEKHLPKAYIHRVISSAFLPHKTGLLLQVWTFNGRSFVTMYADDISECLVSGKNSE
jgi:hypothetical protein